MKCIFTPIFSLLLFAPSAFGQKKEIKNAQKELNAGNLEQVIAILSPVEYLINNASDEERVHFHYLKGTALLNLASKNCNASKNLSQAIISFNDVINVEKESTRYKYTPRAIESLHKIKEEIINRADADLTVGNYLESSNKYYEAYLIDKKDTLQLYNAAVSYKKANDNVLALKCFEELKDINYLGNVEIFIAYSKEKFKDEYFATAQERNAKIQVGSHIRPREEFQSKKAEIFKNIALIYVQNGYKEKAIKAIALARDFDSQSLSLALIEANLYLQTKDFDYFDSLASAIIESKPDNAELLTSFGENCHNEKYYEGAEYYFKKAICIDPKYSEAYVGLVALLVEKSFKITTQMNDLGSSASDKKALAKLKSQKEEIAKVIFPYLEKVVSIDPFNSSVKQLINCINTMNNPNARTILAANEKTRYNAEKKYAINKSMFE